MKEVKFEPWNGFKGENWKQEINVSAFIDANYKEYRGDDSFLVGKSAKTTKVWAKCEKLLAKERKVGLLVLQDFLSQQIHFLQSSMQR